jgi:hypothetical protein
MKAQQGQISDINKNIKNVNADNIEIIAEGGSDNGETFNGTFIARIGKNKFKFEDGKITKRF